MTIAEEIAAHLEPFFRDQDVSKLSAPDLFEYCMPKFANALRSDLEDALLILVARGIPENDNKVSVVP